MPNFLFYKKSIQFLECLQKTDQKATLKDTIITIDKYV